MILEEFPKYDITRDGRVISLDYNHTGKPKEIVQKLNKYGYMQVGITNNLGVRKFRQVHRLVGIAFVKNKDNKPEINHIDGNKANNNYSNLEWCTSSENQIHAFRTGLNKAHKSNVNGNHQGEDVMHSKLTESDVLEIRKRHSINESPEALAKEYKVSTHSINCVVSRTSKLRTWKHLPYPKNRMDMKDKQRKKVMQLSLEGNIINEFSSLLNAEQCTGVAHTGISKVCRDLAKTAGGYIWKYKG